MVVLTLAVVSAGLLLALRWNKEPRRRVQCAANLRQLGAALSLYAGDWLRGELVLVLEVVGADHADLFHAVAKRLLAVDMLAAVHAPVGHERVRVIGRAADHRLNVFLVQTLAPIYVLLGPRELLRAKSQVLLVHVTQRDDVLRGHASEMRLTPAPRADESDVQFVAGGVGSEELGPWQDEPSGSGKGDGFEEVATFHAGSLVTQKRGVKLIRPFFNHALSRTFQYLPHERILLLLLSQGRGVPMSPQQPGCRWQAHHPAD